MKKLFRITTYPISLRRLLDGQLRFFSDHFQMTAIANPSSELDELGNQQGVRTIGIPLSRKITPIQDLISLWQMTRLFLKEKPDIIHTHTPKAGLIGMVAGWLTRCPKRIHTVAGLPLMASTGFKKQILIAVERITYACATVVIPNSQGLYQYISDNHMCDPKKLHFIEPGSSNGINLDYFSLNAIQPEIMKIRLALNLYSDIFVFAFAGRIVRDKGIQELVAAFCKLATTSPQIRLLIIGDFDHGLNPISEDARKTLIDHPQIIMVGFQTDIRPYLAVSDMLVLPSYREGLPQILLQACAMDTPCIATDIMGCNEIITEKNGQLVEAQSTDSLYQAMNRAISNTDKVNQWKSQARESIKHYDQQLIWQQLLDIYTDNQAINSL